MIAVNIYLVYILKGIPLPKCALHNQSYGVIAPPPEMPPKCRRPLKMPACRDPGSTLTIRCKNASAVIYSSVILNFQTSVRKLIHSFEDRTVEKHTMVASFNACHMSHAHSKTERIVTHNTSVAHYQITKLWDIWAFMMT
jgi:hypothetical protein